jgi:hypothetical protein
MLYASDSTWQAASRCSFCLLCLVRRLPQRWALGYGDRRQP